MDLRGDLRVRGEVAADSFSGTDFYGLTFRLADSSARFPKVDTLIFETDSFYITQNVKANEVTLNFRGTAGGGGSGETNTASNLAGDEGLFTTKSGFNLPFKSLTIWSFQSFGDTAGNSSNNFSLFLA